MFSIGRNFYINGGFLIPDAQFVLSIIISSLAAIAILLLITKLADLFESAYKKRREEISNDTQAIKPKNIPSWAHRILLFVVIMILWIPAFLAFYPGNYSSDGPIQVTYLLNYGHIDLHWPAAHTLLLTGIISLGNEIFGSYNAGLSLFCVVQGCMIAFALSVSADKLVSWGVSRIFVYACLAALVLNPLVQSYVFSTVKDMLFAAFFLLAFVYLVQLAVFSSQDEHSICTTAAFGVYSFLCFLMRKQGLFVILLAVVITIIFVKSNTARKRLSVSLVCAIAASLVFGAAVSQIFTTKPDSVRELLSLPSQQIVRTYMYDYESLDTEQIEEIGVYYDLEELESGRTSNNYAEEETTEICRYFNDETGCGYQEPVADPAKSALNTEAFSANVGGYFATYVHLAQEHLSCYTDAFLWSCIGYVYPTTMSLNVWSGLTAWNQFGLTIDAGGENNQISNYNESSLLPSYRDFLVASGTTMYAGCPPLTLAASPSLPFYAMIVSLVLILRKPGTAALAAATSLPWIFFIVLPLAPVMCSRYVLPLFLSIPFLLGLPFVRIPQHEQPDECQ